MKATQNDYLKISSQMLSYRSLTSCRVCGGSFSGESLELSPTGLANELYADRQSALDADRFPLEVVMCIDCKHFQLKHIVDANRLFSQYVYRSGTSTFFKSHFKSLAGKLEKMFINKSPKVFEVGSNDGLLLSSLKERGIVAIGLEPSKILVEECANLGLEVIHGFLNTEIVENVKSKWGFFDVVVGNNVFAHIDDLRSAFLNVHDLLFADGYFIFEVADFSQIKKKGIFDSIYHEHMSFHTLTGLQELAKQTDFTVSDFEYVNSHGGSFRFILQKGGHRRRSKVIEDKLRQEKYEGLNSPYILKEIRDAITSRKQRVTRFLESLNQTETFIGYGAPAKAVTFISEMGLQEIGINAIIDDNEWKQKKFLPVSGIEIVSKEQALRDLNLATTGSGVNFLVFPWNLSADLLQKLREWAPRNSKSICFFPELEVTKL